MAVRHARPKKKNAVCVRPFIREIAFLCPRPRREQLPFRIAPGLLSSLYNAKPKMSSFPPSENREEASLGVGHPLVAVVGPTGSGKSELALRLAEKFEGEIVNCDSVQIFTYFNIG